ncbi:MAG: hypothetical protein ACLPYS_20480 [Vulcanimicrobiaceae bacterium]
MKAPEAEQKEQRILMQAEAKRLLDAVDPRPWYALLSRSLANTGTKETDLFAVLEAAKVTHWYALLRLALVSGMREGELFALTVGDLRLEDEHPHLLVNATLTEGADGLERTPPKTRRAVAALTSIP